MYVNFAFNVIILLFLNNIWNDVWKYFFIKINVFEINGTI